MTTHSYIRTMPAQAPSFQGLFTRLTQIGAARRQRAALERLDDTMLKDIGITRAEALAESRRPVWDVPAHWRR